MLLQVPEAQHLLRPWVIPLANQFDTQPGVIRKRAHFLEGIVIDVLHDSCPCTEPSSQTGWGPPPRSTIMSEAWRSCSIQASLHYGAALKS